MRDKICMGLLIILLTGSLSLVSFSSSGSEGTRLPVDSSAYKLIPLNLNSSVMEDDTYQSTFFTAMGGLNMNTFTTDADWLTWELTDARPMNMSGIAAQWNFDTGDASDSSGNQNDGFLHGTSSVSGISSNSEALSFDGDDYVDIPHSQTLNITDEITLEAWIYPTIDDLDEYMIISKGGSWSNEDPQCYELTIDDARPLFQMKLPDSEDWYGAAPSEPITMETWHHVAGVYDGSLFRIYIDGVNQTNIYNGWGGTYKGKVYNGGLPTGDFNISIGRRSPASWGSLFYEGYIDDVRIWDRAIPESEMIQHSVIPGSKFLNLTGIPDNGDVGENDVWINVTDNDGRYDEFEFTIKVENTQPNIITENVLNVFQDEEYSVQYQSDEETGDLSWDLEAETVWLQMDSDTGLLSGTPGNDDVGIHEITMTFNDGNGGIDSTTFDLEVIDVNDAPRILTENSFEAYEDQYFEVDYDFMDIDGEDVNWTMSTDAKWLSIDLSNGIVNGTPDNDDVGNYTVNITATDPRGLWDSTEFVVTVFNTNDVPFWVDVPENTSVDESDVFYFDFNANDVDLGDNIIYSISTDPEINCTFDVITGVLQWNASRLDFDNDFEVEDLDRLRIDILASATDGEETIDHIFHIDLILNPSPVTALLTPLNGSTIGGKVILEWEGSDDGDLPLSYDVYLHESKADVLLRNEWALIAEDVLNTTLDVEGLDTGITYFWTVIAHDKYSSGLCTDEAFSFYLNSPPEATMLSPKNGSIVPFHEILLKSSGIDPELDTLEYHFFVSISKADVEDLSETSLHISDEPTLVLDSLQPGSLYYWTVICRDEYEFGESLTGIHTFKVNTPPEIIQVDDQEGVAGSEFTIDINGSDMDGDQLQFGMLSGPVGMVIVPSTGLVTWTPSSDESGQYEVLIGVSDGLDSSNTTFMIDIKEPEEIEGEVEEEGSLLPVLLIIIVAVLIIFALLVIFLLARRKKDDTGSEENQPVQEVQEDIPDYLLGVDERPVQEDLYPDPLAYESTQPEVEDQQEKFESIVPEALSEEESNMRSSLLESESPMNPQDQGSIIDGDASGGEMDENSEVKGIKKLEDSPGS